MGGFKNTHLTTDSEDIQPKSLKKFNWGAFVMWNLWGISNGVPILMLWFILLMPELYLALEDAFAEPIGSIFIFIAFALNFLSPIILLVLSFYWGFKGNRIAWIKKQWDSVEQFENIQKKWNTAGKVVLLLIILLSIILLIINM